MLNSSVIPKGITDEMKCGRHQCFLKKETISPEEMAERINAVTREEIAAAAASMKLDTVYVLAPEAKGEEE